MNIFFDKEPVSDLDELPARYRPEEFESSTRSTIPLLSLLKHGGDTWRGIVEGLGCDGDHVEAHLEFTVDPPRGRGRSSHTDLMLLDSGRGVAIEAKRTEGRYDTVGEGWTGEPRSRTVVR